MEVLEALEVQLNKIIRRGVDDTHHHHVSVDLGGLLTVDANQVRLVNVQSHREYVEEMHTSSQVVNVEGIVVPLEDDQVLQLL